MTGWSHQFGVVDPNVYQSIGLGGSTRFSQYGAFSPATDFAGSAGGGRGFDKIDGLGGVKLKRADLDREAECEFWSPLAR